MGYMLCLVTRSQARRLYAPSRLRKWTPRTDPSKMSSSRTAGNWCHRSASSNERSMSYKLLTRKRTLPCCPPAVKARAASLTASPRPSQNRRQRSSEGNGAGRRKSTTPAMRV